MTNIILIVLVYMLYSFSSQLYTFYFVEHQQMGLAQWGMLALCVAFVPMIVFMGIRAWRENKKNQAERAEQEKKAAAERAERRRGLYTMDEEGFDESYAELDRLAAEKAAKLAAEAAKAESELDDDDPAVPDDELRDEPTRGDSKSKYDE